MLFKREELFLITSLGVLASDVPASRHEGRCDSGCRCVSPQCTGC